MFGHPELTCLAIFGPVETSEDGSLGPLGFPGAFARLDSGLLRNSIDFNVSAFQGEFCPCHVFESLVRPALVGIDLPAFDFSLRFIDRFEPMKVQTLITK
jgi:hypothetical protein